MVRAFEEREGCSVPSTPSINPDDYVFDSCGVPDVSNIDPFSMAGAPGTIPQPAKVSQEGCIIGYLVVGQITGVSSEPGPPSNHKYKAADHHGCISIDAWTEPINSNVRPESTIVDPAAEDDKCLLGYWGETPVLVAWEKPESGLRVEFCEPNSATPADGVFLLVDVTDKDGTDTGEGSVKVFGNIDRTSTRFSELGWDDDTGPLTWLRFPETVYVSGNYIAGVLVGLRPEGLPSASGKSQYMVLQLDGSTPKVPLWDWTRFHT